MGAVDDMTLIHKSETINDRTIKDEVEKLIDQARYDYGNSGYTGSIAEADGVRLRLNIAFEIEAPRDWDAEYDFTEAVADKWGPAVVCRATQDDEDIGYVICGIYSS